MGNPKGNEFELATAKDILAAVGAPFGKKDCYRTPMSGGHPFAGESDLIVTPALQVLVPFVIECKHRNKFRSSHLFFPTAEVKGYHLQVLGAATRDRFNRFPLLVMRGKDRESYAGLRSADLNAWLHDVPDVVILPRLYYDMCDALWTAIPWALFLELLSKKAQAVKVPNAA